MSQLVYFITFTTFLLTLISIIFNVYLWKNNEKQQKTKDISLKNNSQLFDDLKKTINYNASLIEYNRTKMNEINDNVKANKSIIDQNESKLRTQDELIKLSDIRDLRTDIDKNKTNINQNKTNINQNQTNLSNKEKELRDDMNSQFGILGGRVNANSNALFGHESQFETLRGRVNDNSNALFGLDSQFDTLRGRVNNNSNALFGPQSQFETLRGRVNDNSNALFGHQSQFETLRGRVNDNSNALFGPQSQFETLRGRVNDNSMLFGDDSEFEMLRGRVDDNSNALFGQEPQFVTRNTFNETLGVQSDSRIKLPSLNTVNQTLDSLKIRVNTNSNALFGPESQFETLRGRVNDNSNALFGPESRFDELLNERDDNENSPALTELQDKVNNNSNVLFGVDSQFALLVDRVHENSNALFYPGEKESGLLRLVNTNSNMLFGDDSEFEMLRGKVNANSNALIDFDRNGLRSSDDEDGEDDDGEDDDGEDDDGVSAAENIVIKLNQEIGEYQDYADFKQIILKNNSDEVVEYVIEVGNFKMHTDTSVNWQTPTSNPLTFGEDRVIYVKDSYNVDSISDDTKNSEYAQEGDILFILTPSSEVSSIEFIWYGGRSVNLTVEYNGISHDIPKDTMNADGVTSYNLNDQNSSSAYTGINNNSTAGISLETFNVLNNYKYRNDNSVILLNNNTISTEDNTSLSCASNCFFVQNKDSFNFDIDNSSCECGDAEPDGNNMLSQRAISGNFVYGHNNTLSGGSWDCSSDCDLRTYCENPEKNRKCGTLPTTS